MPTSLNLSLDSTASLLDNPRPIVVALHFKSSDAPRLWDLASRHHMDTDDVSLFAKAARATERGMPIVLECTERWQIEQAKAWFPKHGIEPPRVEELRI